MANYEAERYDFSGANLTGIQGVNTGIVVPWGSASIPSGFLLCDGTSYATSAYAALFAIIGYTYGGSGANFNVPDLRDRTVVGVSSANSKALAQGIGANTVTPTGNTGAKTLTTAQIASHTHTAAVPSGAFNYFNPQTGSGAANMNSGSTGGGQSHDHTLSIGATSVIQPGLVLNYIIKT